MAPREGLEPSTSAVTVQHSALNYLGTKTGSGGENRTPDPVIPRHVPFHSATPLLYLGWLEELESSFTGSQPAALPYKLQPHLVDDRGIEPRLDGCRPSVLPLSLVALTWSGRGESNSVRRPGKPTLNQ